MSTQDITTILGKGSAFDGKLTFEGAVRIDGEFSGEIRTDGTLIVGQTAEVKAEISAAQIIVEGTIRGDLKAKEAIEIHAPARVYGNLATPSLEIQKGSLFEGNAQMENSGAQVTAGNSKPRREPKSSETVAPA
jgi:cytoskeletal protein CcmA (bactofilin family)